MSAPPARREVARYHYTDASGTVLYSKVRMEPKTFRQCRQSDGRTIWSLGDVPRVLYRLADVRAAVAAGQPIYLAEGEKDADALANKGVTATTWTEGAWRASNTPKWRSAYTEALAGAHVVIVRDRDPAGIHTAVTIAELLLPVAASVLVTEPATGNDVTDHLNAGYTINQFSTVRPEPDTESTEAQAVRLPGDTWQAVELQTTLSGLLDGTIKRLAPTVGTRNDGNALIYRGKVNGIAGASGSGKSWTALLCCAQELAAGDHAVYVDLEDDAASVLERLLLLGADPDVILDQFHYVHPDEQYGDLAAARLTALVERAQPTLVVIDSTGESLALDGAKPNDDDDVARWFRRLPTRIARLGPAVVILDHVVKADESGLWPIGSQRKRAAISGAQYMQTAVRMFDRDTDGLARLVCAKDRHGNYRQGMKVAELHVTPSRSDAYATLRNPPGEKNAESSRFRPTTYMERVSRALEEAPTALTFRGIDKTVRGKQQYIKSAVDALASEGYVNTQPGLRNSTLHTSARPYRQTDDPRSDAFMPQGDSRAETVSSDAGTVSPSKDETGETDTHRLLGDSGETVGDTPPLPSATAPCAPICTTEDGAELDCFNCHYGKTA